MVVFFRSNLYIILNGLCLGSLFLCCRQQTPKQLLSPKAKHNILSPLRNCSGAETLNPLRTNGRSTWLLRHTRTALSRTLASQQLDWAQTKGHVMADFGVVRNENLRYKMDLIFFFSDTSDS